jgi:hypothetical protein
MPTIFLDAGSTYAPFCRKMPACATLVPCAGAISLFRLRSAAAAAGRRIQQPSPIEPNRLDDKLDDESEGTNPNGHQLWEAARFDSRLGETDTVACVDLMMLALRKDAGDGSERYQNERRVEVLLWWVLPIEKFHFVDGPRFGAEEYDQPQPIGQIRIARKICARIGCG